MLSGNRKSGGTARWKTQTETRRRIHLRRSNSWKDAMRLQFQTVDVFTGQQFLGNPLAVVLNAEALSSGQMQAIAAEFNLAETTFVRPPKDPAHIAEIRIFTPRSEMPFAGHPNVGTAYVLARAGVCYGRPVNSDRVIFEEKAGLVPIEILKDGTTIVGARLAAPQPLSIGAEIAGELVASACGISPADIETANHRPCIASCGAPFILAELKTRAALAAARPNGDVFRREVAKHPVVSIMIYTQVDEADIQIRARMFAPHLNIPEDPATGSANVALIGLLAKLRAEANLSLSKTIAQGVEMGRTSILQATAEKQNGVVIGTFVGGRCVPVMSGTIDLR
jgi:trans-2,3-dihydro-3-hydroxyanthranilate isomerase